MTPKEYFTKEWGTGFIKATLQEKKGLINISMKDIYDTMESYHQHKLSEIKESVCDECEGEGVVYDEDGISSVCMSCYKESKQ